MLDICCIKRKIRNYIQMKYQDVEGFDMYVDRNGMVTLSR